MKRLLSCKAQMIVQAARRTRDVREYYFSIKNRELAALDEKRLIEGLLPIINLGIGAPDGMPPADAISALAETAFLSDSHKYQNYRGLPELREAFCNWYKRYYGVSLDPSCEVQPLAGSKEGILLTSLAFVDKGDKVLVPDPGYPTYLSASNLVEAEILTYRLREDNGWYPDFDELEQMDLRGVKLMWVNYPNMPTGAASSRELFRRLVDFGKKHNILIINDNPYSFVLNPQPLSILSVEGSDGVCLELNSLSKAHNMSGWRIGMIAGHRELISEVLKVKSQMDSGMFKPMQMAAIAALEQGPEWFESLNAEYSERQKAAGRLFDALGVTYDPHSTGLFLWGRVPENSALTGGVSSATLGERFSDALLAKTGIFVTPGFIFGHGGDNYVRASLCADVETFEDAIERTESLSL